MIRFTTGGGGGGASVPVFDTTERVKGSSDETKQLRFEVDGLPASTTRVLTPPGQDGTLAISPLTTKGDLWVYAAASARLPVGSNGQVIVADSTAASGLAWTNTIQVATAAAVPLVLKGASSQTANLQEWQRNDAYKFVYVSAGGQLR